MPPQIKVARPPATGGAGRGRPSPGGTAGGFRGTGAFKPPRPRQSAGAASTASRRVDVDVIDDEDDEDADELERSRISNASVRRRRTAGNEEDEEDNDDNDIDNEAAAAAAASTSNSAPSPSKSIPPALLARLLHHFFQNPSGTATRLTQDAHAAVDKYMEIFIREAVARSVAERGDGAFLDVDVLQKVAGQLIMDM